MSQPLSRRLRLETATLHAEVERTGVMAALLRGELSRQRYCALLLNLRAVYAALEDGLRRHARVPAVAAVHLPALARAEALAADLRALLCAQPPHAPALADATRRYTRRLQALAERSPTLLVAHAYVRYLGDLHGGQLLSRLVARGLGLGGEDGTRFYHFGDAAAVRKLRADFRAGLDAIPAGDATADALVSEARTAFELHRALFTELAEEHDTVVAD